MSIPDRHLPENPDDSYSPHILLRTLLKIPGTRIDREQFLADQFESNDSEEPTNVIRPELSQAGVPPDVIISSDVVQYGPPRAGVPPERICELADACIKAHVRKASLVSFGAGLPGGFAIAATIPLDIVQFYRQALILAQKLAYLYGMDKPTNRMLTELLAIMMVTATITNRLDTASRIFAEEAAKRLYRKALTKTFYYPLIKKAGKWVGVSITKQNFSKGVSKFIPIVGGVVSGSVTLLMMRRAGNRLKKNLHKVAFGSPCGEDC